jgi:hypothetical protein
MNPTLKLLRVIGSPFSETGKEQPADKDEALALYDHAVKNKIGLLYLDSLEKQGKLQDYGLTEKHSEELHRYDEQTATVLRISEVYNSEGVDYAIFKSLMPFRATPNDVDIIHFGKDEEYRAAAELMLRSNYVEVKGPVDSRQRMFHDARNCQHGDAHKKDIYDIDVYQKISASHVLYVDKEKLKKRIVQADYKGVKYKALADEAELMVIIIHSIIPEMIHTLFVYYATLYYVQKMGDPQLKEFLEVSKENNVTYSVRAHLSIVAGLHKAAHGTVPERVSGLLKSLGGKDAEEKGLLKQGYKTPYKYSVPTVVRILLEKTRENEFRKSAVKQAFYMLNPKMARWVVSEILIRRKRETY